VDVLVGTTRNLVRALERGYVKADKLEWVVVDEADVLLGESKGNRAAFEEDKGSST
jgi:superfamily II DNA/RNA helicase